MLNACIPMETARPRPQARISQTSDAPVHDIFGFPVGIKHAFLNEDGSYTADFQLALTEFYGTWCGGDVAGEVRKIYLHETALSHFEAMAAEAAESGIEFAVCSGYRGYKFQIKIQGLYPHRAAPPGFSEHHLGTVVDLRHVRWNDETYLWLTENAHLYGFILSYYRGHNIAGFPEEANHWRFIGVEPAKTYYEMFKLHY